MAHRLGITLFTLLAMAWVSGCDGGSQAGTAGSGGDTGSGGGGAGATAGSGGMDGTGGGPADLPPTDQDAIFDWLKAGSYTGWAAESGPHPSTGPHGGSVRTFVNDALLGSLEAANTVHPKDACAVKELYGGGSTITGWAVELKTDADSAGGQGWYWYEIYSATDPSSPVAAGNGKSLCFNCHSGGVDYVLTPFPLQ
jgi:hypothetical protein